MTNKAEKIDIKKKMAFLIGMKFKQVRERLNKSLEKSASFLDISTEELQEYEAGSLDIEIGSSAITNIFKFWGTTHKDIFFYQILNLKNVEEIFDFYKTQDSKTPLDYVDYLLTNESSEMRRILEKKL